MKQVAFLILYLLSYSLLGNMGNPVLEGTKTGSPFVNEHVDILTEDIYISLDTQFETAHFDIQYNIYSDEDGVNIPFLFYAYEYLGDFEIYVDDIKISTTPMPVDLEQTVSADWVDFDYLFGGENKHNIHFMLDEHTGYSLSLEDFIYFETNLSQGEHSIRITYIATHWNDQSGWVNDYSIRYSLTPAKYWKSFGSLNITIDSRNFKNDYTTNLGQGQLISDSINTWHFEELPSDLILIKYNPEINPTALFLINLTPMGFANIIGLLLTIGHLYLTFRHRKKNPDVKYSIVVIIGGVSVPLLYILFWLNAYDMIDKIIGPEATKNHGYHFLIIFLLPFMMIPYWLAIWLIDKFYFKKKVYQKTNHFEEDSDNLSI